MSAIDIKHYNTVSDLYKFEKFHRKYTNTSHNTVEENFKKENEDDIAKVNEYLINVYAITCYKLNINPLPLFKYFHGVSFILEKYKITKKHCFALSKLFSQQKHYTNFIFSKNNLNDSSFEVLLPGFTNCPIKSLSL